MGLGCNSKLVFLAIGTAVQTTTILL